MEDPTLVKTFKKLSLLEIEGPEKMSQRNEVETQFPLAEKMDSMEDWFVREQRDVWHVSEEMLLSMVLGETASIRESLSRLS